MGAIVARALMLLRVNRRATLALALIAGLAGGLVLAAWSSSRRGASSFERFLAAAGQPDFMISFCAPSETNFNDCASYDPVTEAAAIRLLGGVQAVSRGAFVWGTYDLHGQQQPGPLSVMLDRGFLTPAGRPVVLAGRLADPANADEIVVPEEGAKLYGIKIGDVVGFTPTPSDKPTTRQPNRLNVVVVGVVRTPADLAAGVGVAELSTSIPFAGPGLWARDGAQAQIWGPWVLVRTARHNRAELSAGLNNLFPGRRGVTVTEAREPAKEKNARDAIGYETTALMVMAVVGAAAWLVFVGQALLRQAARENTDARTLIALGMTRRQLAAAAALRALPVAAGTVLVAVPVSVLCSLATPIARAARAETHPGVNVDAVVVLAGAAGLAAAMIAGLSGAVVARSRSRRAPTVKARRWRLHSPLPVAMVAGASLISSPRRRGPVLRAGLTGAVAVAGAVAGLGLVASLRDLVAHPRGYGTTWDALVAGRDDPFLQPGQPDTVLQALRKSPEAVAGAGIHFDTEGRVGNRAVPIVGLWSVYGPPQRWSVITAGRAPKNHGEVALGPKTIRALGLSIGDDVEVRMSSQLGGPLTVVGETLFYDGLQVQPGDVAVVDASWFGNGLDRADNIVLRASSSHPDWGSLRKAGFTVVPAPPPPGVQNLRGIDRAPGVIAAIIALLAFAAFGHTIVTTATSQKRQLAVLRAIGFTRRQLTAATAGGAIIIVAIGISIGIPAGLVAQRSIWTALERQIGFSSPWFTGVGPIIVIGVAALLAPAFGATQGWIASRRSPADALRAE